MIPTPQDVRANAISESIKQCQESIRDLLISDPLAGEWRWPIPPGTPSLVLDALMKELIRKGWSSVTSYLDDFLLIESL